jgi:site-specific DNA recombinase
MKAAIYCRVSTEDQEREGTSLDTQVSGCVTKAKELNYETPGDYIFKEAWTGVETDRPKLNELRDLIRQRLIDAVICYSTDRLARNPIHIAIIAEECDKRGIELIFVTEPCDNSPEGHLIRYVKGYAAQIEYEKIRERTIRGKREKCRQGKMATGGGRLFGYNWVDGKREININEAEIVSQIFNWFAAEEYTLYRAAGELNRTGIQRPMGGKWSEQTVYRLLINPAYKGVTCAFRYKAEEPGYRKNPNSHGKTRHVLRDRKDWVEIPGATPAIVTTEVWDKAQGQLQINRSKSRRNRKYEYMLTNGRLRCGVCGRSMIGSAKVRAKWILLYYRCICNIKSNYYSPCPQPSIRASKIENIVWDEIINALSNRSIVDSELNRLHSGDTFTMLEAEEILLRKRLSNLADEETRYLRLYGQGNLSEKKYLAEVERLKRNANSLEAKLKKIQGQKKFLVEAESRLDRISEAITIIKKRLQKADYNLKRLAIEALDVTVTVEPEGQIRILGSIPMQLHDAKTPALTTATRWL